MANNNSAFNDGQQLNLPQDQLNAQQMSQPTQAQTNLFEASYPNAPGAPAQPGFALQTPWMPSAGADGSGGGLAAQGNAAISQGQGNAAISQVQGNGAIAQQQGGNSLIQSMAGLSSQQLAEVVLSLPPQSGDLSLFISALPPAEQQYVHQAFQNVQNPAGAAQMMYQILSSFPQQDLLYAMQAVPPADLQNLFSPPGQTQPQPGDGTQPQGQTPAQPGDGSQPQGSQPQGGGANSLPPELNNMSAADLAKLAASMPNDISNYVGALPQTDQQQFIKALKNPQNPTQQDVQQALAQLPQGDLLNAMGAVQPSDLQQALKAGGNSNQQNSGDSSPQAGGGGGGPDLTTGLLAVGGLGAAYGAYRWKVKPWLKARADAKAGTPASGDGAVPPAETPPVETPPAGGPAAGAAESSAFKVTPGQIAKAAESGNPIKLKEGVSLSDVTLSPRAIDSRGIEGLHNLPIQASDGRIITQLGGETPGLSANGDGALTFIQHPNGSRELLDMTPGSNYWARMSPDGVIRDGYGVSYAPGQPPDTPIGLQKVPTTSYDAQLADFNGQIGRFNNFQNVSDSVRPSFVAPNEIVPFGEGTNAGIASTLKLPSGPVTFMHSGAADAQTLGILDHAGANHYLFNLADSSLSVNGGEKLVQGMQGWTEGMNAMGVHASELAKLGEEGGILAKAGGEAAPLLDAVKVFTEMPK